jgi:hypothetical protein
MPRALSFAGAPGNTREEAMPPLGVGEGNFSADETAELERLREQDTAAGRNLPLDPNDTGLPASTTVQPADTTPTSQVTDPPTDPPKTDTPAQQTPAAAAPPPKGDPHRAALRAARHAERVATQRAEELAAENERLRKLAGTQADPEDPLSDTHLDSIEEDYSGQGKALKAIRDRLAAVQPQPATTTAKDEPEFVPVQLPDAVQSIIDDIPDLLTWQTDRDQTRFAMAQAAEQMLAAIPKWQGTSPDQVKARLEEVARRVNAEMGSAAAPPPAPGQPRIDPQQALREAPIRTPGSASELGGGGGDPKQSDLARFARMSDDDIVADLVARGG